jgi:hypothetical protein
MYKKVNFIESDPNKKNLLFFCNQLDTKHYTYSYMFPMVDVLKEHFNIYFVLESTRTGIEKNSMNNVYYFTRGYWKKNVLTRFLRKSENENATQLNNDIVVAELEKCFKNEPIFHRIFVIDNHNLMLPYNKFSNLPGLDDALNDYFEFPNQTPEQTAEIDRINKKIFDSPSAAFGPLTFMYFYKCITLNLLTILHKKHNCRIDPIIIDATAGTPYFKIQNINHKFWYYVDDFRDGRMFHGFPFVELQHLVYEKQYQKLIEKNLLEGNEKDINFLFSGSLMNLKGTRKFIWKEFFKDFRYPNSEMYFADKSFLLPEDEEEQMKSEIYSHPSYKGDFMDNKVFVNKLKKSKTSFIARSVQHRDGLTYRPIQLLDLDILPIFDYRYDPDYLQIPKEFQDILRVHNSEELIKVVDFYCNNEKERIDLLNKMKIHFRISEWTNNWKELLKETELYKELINELL